MAMSECPNIAGCRLLLDEVEVKRRCFTAQYHGCAIYLDSLKGKKMFPGKWKEELNKNV